MRFNQFHLKSACVIALLTTLQFLVSCAETLPTGKKSGNLEFDLDVYNSANTDVIRGGKLYDKWWEENNKETPTGSNPVWSKIIENPLVNQSNGNQGGQWRCKECHGWDYKGSSGDYASGSHFTGVRGLQNQNPDFTPEHVFNMLVDGLVTVAGVELPHRFYDEEKMLNERDIYDLTKFVIQRASLDTANPALGDAARGQVVYENPNRTSCTLSGCHTSGSLSPPSLEAIIEVAQTNPREFLHKVRFGQPGVSLMPSGLNAFDAQDLLAYFADGLGDGGGGTPPTSDFNQALYDALGRDAVTEGGQIYDKFWTASGGTQQSTRHPQWPASNTSISAPDTWRCKECHGWDYRGRDGAYKDGSHRTGIQGIVNTASATMQYVTADNVYSFLKTDVNHGFSGTFFTNDEYYSLTKFVMTMRQESATGQASFSYIDDQTKLAKNGNTTRGQNYYDSTQLYTSFPGCASTACHGPDGKRIDFADGNPNSPPNEFVSDIAVENPWELIHKVRFGEPAGMPDLYTRGVDATAQSMQAAVDILAYTQTNLAPNIKRAGLLYDKWWETSGVKDATTPAVRNPLWSGTADAALVSNADTWRCKECHGWDYQGVHGAYSDTTSKHFSGIRGFIFLGTINASRDAIISDIKNGPTGMEDGHAFGAVLSDEDIALLADFIRDGSNGVPKTTAEYNVMLTNGNATLGQTIYKNSTPGGCEACHGADGTKVPAVNIADVANTNPQEFLHKARYGNPGSTMVPTSNGFIGLTRDDAADVLMYSKTLGPGTGGTPSYENASVVRGGRLYDEWWAEMQVSDSNVQAPTQTNPLWELRSANLADLDPLKKVTYSWRCKTCHAWDYKGVGFFTGTKSDTGYDNLIYMINLRRQTLFINDEAGLQQWIFDWIKTGKNSGTHNYGEQSTRIPTPLTDKDIWDLTKFMLGGGLIDSASNILGLGVVIGTDNTNGEGLYTGAVEPTVNCASCHGADGTTPPPVSTGGSGEPLDIIAIAAPNDDPWEFLHKVRFGQPGTSMPSIYGTGTLTDQDAFDVLGYGQQLFNSR